MTITPDKLRSYHAMAVASLKTTTWAPIMANECAMLADAMEIADSAARADIECQCRCAGDHDTGHWWDTASADPEDREGIEQSMRYLDARGLLIRQPGADHIVSFREPA